MAASTFSPIVRKLSTEHIYLLLLAASLVVVLLRKSKVAEKLGVDTLERRVPLLLLLLQSIVAVSLVGLVPVGVILLLDHFEIIVYVLFQKKSLKNRL